MSKLLFIQTLLLSTALGKLLPNEYEEGDVLPIFVSQVESSSVNIPYNYYDTGFCNRPEKYQRNPYIRKNWGEALSGEHWQFSPYEVTLRTEKKKKFDPSEFQCQVVCE